MKKKLISGLLLMALCGAGAISMTSCKDTEDDLYTELASKDAELGVQLDQLAAQLAQCSINCNNKIEALRQDIENNTYTKVDIDRMLAALSNLYAAKSQVDAIQSVIDHLKSVGLDNIQKWEVDNLKDLAANHGEIKLVAALANDVQALKDLAAKKDELLALLNAGSIEVPDIAPLENAVFGTPDADGVRKGGLVDRVADLEGYLTLEDGTKISKADFQTAIANGTWMTNYKSAIEDMYTSLKKEDGNINTDALDALMKWYTQFDKFNKMFSTFFPGVTIDKETGDLVYPVDPETGTAPEGWWNFPEVMDKLAECQVEIEQLKQEINYLTKRFDDLVTGLVLQATDNSIFGGFNTPFGFNSMVLMTYYGKASTDINFPLEDSEDAGLKGNVWGGLKVAGQTFGGTLYNEDLGTLYFTVNPVGANVNADGFVIENSKEVASPVKITVTPSDAELSFGFGRSVSNGFYEASVKLDATQADAESKLDNIKINITDGMVDALKNVYNNRGLSDVGALAKTVYSNLQNVCTANALRYNWTSTTGGYDAEGNAIAPQTVNNSVLSQYGLAVTAFKPLSFVTLRNTTTDRDILPTFGDFQIDKDLVNMNFKPFEFDDVTLNIDLQLDGFYVDEVGDTWVEVKVPAKFDTEKDPVTGEYSSVLPDNWENMEGYYKIVKVNIKDDLNKVVNELQNSVTEWIKGNGKDRPGIENQINQAIKDAVDKEFNGKDGLISKIENQVNDMTGSIQDKLYDLVDKINGDKYLGRLNKIVARYNKLANKINEVFHNPNHYLQATMLYETANGGVNFVSNAKENYTRFTYDGGEGVTLWATTYNFETLTPVYKKYVAVTKVTVDGVENSSLLEAANSGQNMNEIIDGYTKEVVLATKDVVTAGHTYSFEVTYRALDYQGYTSTCRYYLVVDAK